MKKYLLYAAGAFVLFALIPAVILYFKGRMDPSYGKLPPPSYWPAGAAPGGGAPGAAPANNEPMANAGSEPLPDVTPSPPVGNQLSNEEKEQKEAQAREHLNKVRSVVGQIINQKKYAYIRIKEEDLEDELMRQLMIMMKLKKQKSVKQAVEELLDGPKKELLITPQNENQKLKEVEAYYFKKIRAMKYEERRDLCNKNGGAFTGSAVYQGDLVEQFLRACVCTNTNSSLKSRPWAQPVLYSLSCAKDTE